MPALLVNIKIDLPEKFALFRATLADISGLFDEHHVKIRGKLSRECIEYARSVLGEDAYFHQDIQERDWVSATLEILAHVQSRSVFIYFEDHRLVADRNILEQTIVDFDRQELDYLCYSFFRSSQLEANNLLPLGAVPRAMFHEFVLDQRNLELIGKLSPGYYTFSLVSLVSVKYWKELLLEGNQAVKIFHKKGISLIDRLFPYPRYRAMQGKINRILGMFGARWCLYPPSSPFNLEKIWFESFLPKSGGWRFGIPRQELFANYDDDNGFYGESLIKKGLYPLEACSFEDAGVGEMKSVDRRLTLTAGESFDCAYYSHNGRISRPPRIEINVMRGRIEVFYGEALVPLSCGDAKLFYSNRRPRIRCAEPAEVQLKIFDEAF